MRTPSGTVDEEALPAPRRRRSLRLPFATGSARTARRLLTTDLDATGTPRAAVADATLVLSELVVNGVDHGRPLDDHTIAVAWTIENDEVEICVSDGGRGAVIRPGNPSAGAPRGRGLVIVESLSRRWWVEGSQQTSICAIVAA